MRQNNQLFYGLRFTVYFQQADSEPAQKWSPLDFILRKNQVDECCRALPQHASAERIEEVVFVLFDLGNHDSIVFINANKVGNHVCTSKQIARGDYEVPSVPSDLHAEAFAFEPSLRRFVESLLFHSFLPVKREFADGFAFQGVVGVQVLARGVEVRVAHEMLDGNDIAAFFKEARGVGVTEFVQRSVLDPSALCDAFEPTE